MSKEFNLPKFYEEDDLSLMKLSDNVSMSTIYDKIKKGDFSFDDKNIKIKKNEEFNNYIIIYNDTISFGIHESPIKIEVQAKKESNRKIYNVINNFHLRQIITKFRFKKPKIKCQTCNSFFECNYLCAIEHKIHELLL